MSELITGRFNLIKNENLIFSWRTLHAQLKAQQLTGEDLCNLTRPPLPHCLLGCIEESKEVLSTCALERPVNKDMASHPASGLWHSFYGLGNSGTCTQVLQDSVFLHSNFRLPLAPTVIGLAQSLSLYQCCCPWGHHVMTPVWSLLANVPNECMK